MEGQPSTEFPLQTVSVPSNVNSYMAVRLLAMRRVLKDTGSIYLHCDPTASHYLKLLMDSIYSQSNFRNEVVWKRTSGRSGAHGFVRVHDTILYYCNTESFTWNAQWLPLSEDHVRRAYRNEDGRGRWQSDQLTAAGLRTGESGEPWRGVDPSDVGRHWATPTQGAMSDYIVDQELIPGWPDKYPSVQGRLDALDEAGLVHWPHDGNGMPRLKRYLDAAKGTAVEDIVIDIAPIGAQARERIGYPTQKPLALIDAPIPYRQNKHVLFGQQEWRCNGCHSEFPFRNFTIDHIIAERRGGTDHVENLQLLYGHCSSVKGDRPQEYLVARLREMGIAA